MAQTAGATLFRSDPLAGVRTRRIFALAVDLVLVSILATVICIALMILTLGLSLLLLPPLFPLIAFFYNGLTVSGRKMATPGMRALGLEMRMHEDGARVPLDISEGDTIIFSKYGGTEVKFGSDEYLILSARDVLAIVQK